MVDLEQLKVGCIIQCIESRPDMYDLGELLVVLKIEGRKIKFENRYGVITTPSTHQFKQATKYPWWHYLEPTDEVTSLTTVALSRTRGTTYKIALSQDKTGFTYIKDNGELQRTIYPYEFVPFNLNKIVGRAANVKLKRYSIW